MAGTAALGRALTTRCKSGTALSSWASASNPTQSFALWTRSAEPRPTSRSASIWYRCSAAAFVKPLFGGRPAGLPSSRSIMAVDVGRCDLDCDCLVHELHGHNQLVAPGGDPDQVAL